MTAVFSAFAVAVLAAAVGLIVLIGRTSNTSRRRTTLLAVGFAGTSLVAVVMLNLVSVYYKKPPLLVGGLAVAVAAALACFVLIGRDIGWRPLRILAVVGIFASISMGFAFIAMSGIVGDDWVQPLYRTRAAQIAEANGFVALMPAGMNLPTDMLPVETLPEPDAGVGMGYEDFYLDERRAEGPVTVADLQAIVAPGARPRMGFDVPTGAVPTPQTVQGQPAVSVEYSYSPKGEGPAQQETTNVAILVFVLDGVEVRMTSQSFLRESSGDWVDVPNLSVAELIEIAETLEPVE